MKEVHYGKANFQYRGHIHKDIEPYACIFDDCTTPLATFSKIEDWSDHLKSHDQMKKWRCYSADHQEAVFHTRQLFQYHIMSGHNGEFTPSQVGILLQECSSPSTKPFEHCPLCSHSKDSMLKVNSFLSHIAGHLVSLALMSLPWRGDESEGALSKGDSLEAEMDYMEDEQGSLLFEDVGQNPVQNWAEPYDPTWLEFSNGRDPSRDEEWGSIFSFVSFDYDPANDPLLRQFIARLENQGKSRV